MTADKSVFDLSGRVAVVTGGNGGIGRAIALGFARAGASVAVLARNEEKNRLVLAELKNIGYSVCQAVFGYQQAGLGEHPLSHVVLARHKQDIWQTSKTGDA